MSPVGSSLRGSIWVLLLLSHVLRFCLVLVFLLCYRRRSGCPSFVVPLTKKNLLLVLLLVAEFRGISKNLSQYKKQFLLSAESN